MLAFFNKRKNYGIKPGLERINRLLELLDHPQNKTKAIHIAGTNGKGSTISYLQHVLMANGYKVGVYVSPSLSSLTGHIFCNDHKISDEAFLQILNIMYPAICELDESGDYPTEYEILTALAFMYFKDHVDIALIETAMGGRYDTTNCFQPILSIITNIDKDHTSFLGETIREITYHKAGIIKDDIPVIVGDVTDEAFNVIQEEATTKQAEIYRLYEEFNYQLIQANNHKQTFTWFDSHGKSIKIAIQMCGEHQVKNSAVAMMAIQYSMEIGYKIDMKKSLIGIEQALVPGRFELIQEKPMIILDGAHNLAGIKAFIDTATEHYRKMNKHLIFAGFKDKELHKMLQSLSGSFSTITVTSFEHQRAASAEYLYNLIDSKHVFKIENWKRAIEAIHKHSANENEVYFITGSLNFIAVVRNYLLK